MYSLEEHIVFLGIYIKVELFLGIYIDYACIYLWAYSTKNFSKMIGQLIVLPARYKDVSYSISSYTLVILLFNLSHSVVCFEIFLHVFHVMSPTPNNIERVY